MKTSAELKAKELIKKLNEWHKESKAPDHLEVVEFMESVGSLLGMLELARYSAQEDASEMRKAKQLLSEFVSWTDFAEGHEVAPDEDDKSEPSEVELSMGDCHRIAVTRHYAKMWMGKNND